MLTFNLAERSRALLRVVVRPKAGGPRSLCAPREPTENISWTSALRCLHTAYGSYNLLRLRATVCATKTQHSHEKHRAEGGTLCRSEELECKVRGLSREVPCLKKAGFPMHACDGASRQ